MRFCYIMLLLIFLSGCATMTTVRSKPNYQEHLHNATVVILPPAAEVSTVDIGGNKERMYDYEYHIEHVLAHRLVSALKSKNFKTTVLSRKDIASNNLIKDVTILQNSYTKHFNDLYKTTLLDQEQAANTHINLGQAAIDITSKTGENLIFLVGYHQTSKTNGARALAFVGSMLVSSSMAANTDVSYLSIGIIDGKNGDLLWTNMTAVSAGFFDSSWSNMIGDAKERDNENIDNLIKLCLNNLETSTKD